MYAGALFCCLLMKTFSGMSPVLFKSLQLQDTWLTVTALLSEVLCGQTINGKVPQQREGCLNILSGDIVLRN